MVDKKPASQSAKKRPNEIVKLINSQTTVRETAVDPKTMYNPNNPDDIYQKFGSYQAYEDMVNDDQISVALNIKKDLIIGSGYHFICEDDDTEDMRYELEVAFDEDIEKPFEDCLMEMLTAYEFGFSVSEKQFKVKDNNTLTLKNIKTRDPVPWLFHQDKFGNVVRYEQQGSTGEFMDVDPESLIHFINNPRFDNPYGTSDLRAAYDPWFIKKQIIKYYAIFMEKAASPIPHASYKAAMAEDDDVNDMLTILKRFQSSTALVYPDDFKVEFLEAKGNGETYIKGINISNMFLGRVLLLPDLLGFQGGETSGGSQALGQEQMQVFFKHIYRRRRSLEKIINEHLVKPLIKWNYGDVDKYPKFKFKPIEEKLAESNAKLWLEAIKSPSYKVTNEDINHFKGIIDFPITEFEDEEMEDDPIDDRSKEPVIDEPKPEPDIKDDFKKKKFKREDFAKRTDTKALGKQLDSSLEVFNTEAKPIINELFEGLYTDLRKSRVLETKKPQKLDTIKFRKAGKKKLEKLINNSFKDLWKKSQALAQGEIFKLNFAIQTAPEFIATLEAENFAAIGDWEYDVTKKARVQMIKALKDGLPIQSVIDVLDEEGKKVLATATERYARTKFTEVMNKARRDYFDKTGVVAGYEYSAILDGRTTEICQRLNGKKFKAGTEPVPPLHFNCRSLLIPITIYEEFEPDTHVGESTINRFIEENIGLGFSRE